MFGQRSERNVPLHNANQLIIPGLEELLKKEDKEVKTVVAPHKRKKAKRDGEHKVRIPSDLPVERIEIDVPEDKKVCPKTGKPLVKIGEETTKKLTYLPGRFLLREWVRPKYALPKGEGIVCADLPDSLLSRSLADESLLAEILIQKFVNHNPLYRIEESFARDGVFIPRQVLSQWVVAAGMALDPLWDRMQELILESGNIFMDESPVNLLAPGKGKTQKAYMWVIAGGRSANPAYRIYSFQESRQHKIAESLLEYYKGTLHSDKYGAYEKLASQKGVLWCPCWAHIRRKFIEAEFGDTELRDWVLRHIKYLFMFERIAWTKTPEERLRIRQKKEIPIIDKIIERINDRLINGKILPKSKLRIALNYFIRLLPHLKNYTKDAWARLDNNVAERAVRPLTIGRKNWLFAGSSRGGHATAVILSLVQTCRALDINPRAYLEDVMRRLMSHPANKLEELMPDRWAASQPSSTSESVGLR